MKNKILVYDDNCPLCTWYSGLFVKYGFLESGGRKAFSTLDDKLLSLIDFNKSRNEIPLLDTSSNRVLYGIDALLEILDQKIPCIKTTGNVAPIKWFLKKFYKLISYNRKVIVAKNAERVILIARLTTAIRTGLSLWQSVCFLIPSCFIPFTLMCSANCHTIILAFPNYRQPILLLCSLTAPWLLAFLRKEVMNIWAR